jgi:hypothetical protein
VAISVELYGWQDVFCVMARPNQAAAAPKLVRVFTNAPEAEYAFNCTRAITRIIVNSINRGVALRIIPGATCIIFPDAGFSGRCAGSGYKRGWSANGASMGYRVISIRGTILCALVASLTASLHARSDEPERVRPATSSVSALPKPSEQTVETLAERLDAGHDWLYRQMQHLFEAIDMQFSAQSQAPIVVPVSPVRIGIDLQFLHRADGFDLGGAPDVEVALALPNLEKRLKLFVTSASLQEAPADPTEERNPLSLGARFAPQTHLNLELGVQASSTPSAFAALRWAQTISLGPVSLYPFIKPYVQSGVGIGTSGGIALEAWHDQWMVRSTSYGDWVRNASATNWSQTLVFGFAPAVIQERRYDLFATGHDLACGVVGRLSVSGDRLPRTSGYEASVLIKRPIHGGWLFGYVEPVTQWNRVSGWHPDVGIRAGLDVLFWGLASVPGEVRAYCGSGAKN